MASFQMDEASRMRKSLFDQGYLDEQFIQLEELQDEDNPFFVQEVVRLYLSDSSRLIRDIETNIYGGGAYVDFQKLDDIMHQLKGSSSSIGARKVKKGCTTFQDYCKIFNYEGCIRAFQEVKQEHAMLKRKLEKYLQLLQGSR